MKQFFINIHDCMFNVRIGFIVDLYTGGTQLHLISVIPDRLLLCFGVERAISVIALFI